MPSFEINIKTTDDPRGIQNATEETVKLTDAMGKLLERAKKKEEYAAAKEALAGMTQEEKEAALAAYKLEQANQSMGVGLTNLEKAVAGTRSTIGGLNSDITVFGKNLGTSADLLSGLGVNIPISPMMLFGGAIKSAGEFVTGSLDAYAAYIEEVDQIATYSGMASEETSRLIQVADDLRIETGSVERALKSMAEKGTVPTIEGLSQLSDRYLAIQDPLVRAQFLTENFGRSGIEMARLMELGGPKIRALTDEVEHYMVVTGESREEAEKYILALDNMDDAVMGLKYSVAKELVPAFTEFIELLTSPSADQAANFINTVFEGTWLESRSSKDARANAETTTPTAVEVGLAPSTYCGIPGHPNYPHAHAPAPGRAAGGPVTAGQLYAINENRPWNGPEYFLAPADGMILPARAAAQQAMGGNQQAIQVNLKYSPAISLANRYEAEQILVPYIREALRKAQ